MCVHCHAAPHSGQDLWSYDERHAISTGKWMSNDLKRLKHKCRDGTTRILGWKDRKIVNGNCQHHPPHFNSKTGHVSPGRLQKLCAFLIPYRALPLSKPRNPNAMPKSFCRVYSRAKEPATGLLLMPSLSAAILHTWLQCQLQPIYQKHSGRMLPLISHINLTKLAADSARNMHAVAQPPAYRGLHAA